MTEILGFATTNVVPFTAFLVTAQSSPLLPTNSRKVVVVRLHAEVTIKAYTYITVEFSGVERATVEGREFELCRSNPPPSPWCV